MKREFVNWLKKEYKFRYSKVNQKIFRFDVARLRTGRRKGEQLNG